MKDIVVIYHGNCPDGFSGAWVAYKKFGNKATYFPAAHQETPPNVTNKEIYFIDFLYDEKITAKFVRENKKVVAIDHHITRREAAALAHHQLFDLGHSGAVLAWKYFFPKKPIPRLLLHIQDFDIWQFKMPFTKEIDFALESYEMNFKTWNRLVREMEKTRSRKKLIENGVAIKKYTDKFLKKIIREKAYEVEFMGHKVLAINFPSSTNMTSYLGKFMCEQKPPIGIIWSQVDDKIKVSLRSNDSVDVRKIAEKFGGGGHKASAGFAFSSKKPLPWKLIK